MKTGIPWPIEAWKLPPRSGHYSITPTLHCRNSAHSITPVHYRLDDGWRRFMLPAFQLRIARVHDYCYGFEARGASDGLKRH